MLTRLVRVQLAIFTIASILGIAVMVYGYVQAPTLLGVGRITVTMNLPASGGLYRFSIVTYRGVQVGKVTAVSPTANGARATLSLNTSPKIPADLQAQVRSVSAVGEQYVDLRPRTDTPPYLQDGSVIAARDTSIPQAVGPMLDQVSALVGSIPKNRLSALLEESFKGFNGAGYDLGSLLDSSATVTHDVNGVADQARGLIDDTVPLLGSQAQTTDAIRIWARSLAGVTEQVAANDPQVRNLLQTGPGFASEAARLLDQIKLTLPVLLANLTTIGQVGVTYHPSLEQLLVLFPHYVASLQTIAPQHNPTGYVLGEFALQTADPPACTVGFLPPSSWRSPADTTTIDTPDGLYCKLPQDSPISVRGARNYPCMGVPGKRAPTVQLCDSQSGFVPLAQREHALGPYPLDPNLMSQGIPPDNRVNADANIYGPPGGTPPPAESPAGAETVPPPPDLSSPTPSIAPSAFATVGPTAGPSVAVAHYNPKTGEYVTPDGQVFQQSDLATAATARTWKDLLPT